MPLTPAPKQGLAREQPHPTLTEMHVRTPQSVTYWSAHHHTSQESQAPAWGERGKNCCGLLTGFPVPTVPSSLQGHYQKLPLLGAPLFPASPLLPPRWPSAPAPARMTAWSHLSSFAQAGPLPGAPSLVLCMKNPGGLSQSSVCTESSPRLPCPLLPSSGAPALCPCSLSWHLQRLIVSAIRPPSLLLGNAKATLPLPP